ncbi:hypothetical protein GCM10010267_16740 [Streptomyces griseorubens]|nr:hypothetical protein GCM10010267_16740 [Streptomyces griseorubens]
MPDMLSSGASGAMRIPLGGRTGVVTPHGASGAWPLTGLAGFPDSLAEQAFSGRAEQSGGGGAVFGAGGAARCRYGAVPAACGAGPRVHGEAFTAGTGGFRPGGSCCVPTRMAVAPAR